MNHWFFVIAAYAVTAASLLALMLQSLIAMRRAEAEAEALGQAK